MSGACKRPDHSDDQDAQPAHGRSADERWMRNSKREESSASSELPDRASPLTPVSTTMRYLPTNGESACHGSGASPRCTSIATRAPPKPPGEADVSFAAPSRPPRAVTSQANLPLAVG